MNKVIETMSKYFLLGSVGWVVYSLIEVAYRGSTHWSMGLVAFIAFLIIGSLNEFYTWEMSFLKQCVIGSIVITTLEFICGYIVNIWLGWNVWDYSNVPFNILGQICLPFSLIWMLLSGVAIVVDDWLRYLWFNEEKPHYYFFKKKNK